MKIVAKAMLRDSAGNLLVLRRSGTHPRFAYHIDFPGGEVEPEEPEASAVAREILEETGIQVAPSSLQLAHRKQLPGGSVHLVFTGTLDAARPKVTLSWEHDEYTWMTARQLLDTPAPAAADSYYETVLQYILSARDLFLH